MNTSSCARLAAVTAIGLLAVAPAAWAQGDFSGPWRTNQGYMRMEQEGDHVRGEYHLRDGRVRGRVEGDVLKGIWAQSSSNQRCYEERMGSEYWGRFWLRLSHDGERIRGRWSYCNDGPGSGGEWTGERD